MYKITFSRRGIGEEQVYLLENFPSRKQIAALFLRYLKFARTGWQTLISSEYSADSELSGGFFCRFASDGGIAACEIMYWIELAKGESPNLELYLTHEREATRKAAKIILKGLTPKC